MCNIQEKKNYNNLLTRQAILVIFFGLFSLGGLVKIRN